MSIKKVTAVAPANIALIKYWGRKDDTLRLPANDSISINLQGIETRTTVTLGTSQRDTIRINGHAVQDHEHERVVTFIDRIRALVDSQQRVEIESENTFPHSVGLASSASAFAALALAASTAFGLELNEQELSRLARTGSGSACRSIPDGFVQWQAGDSDESSYAFSLYPADYWDIVDVIALTEYTPKKVGSAKGHVAAKESPFYEARLGHVEESIHRLKDALEKKDFISFGKVLEADSLSMHMVMMTSFPRLFYWNGTTLEILRSLQEWRAEGLLAYGTIDAGPNVHIIVQAKDQVEVTHRLRQVVGVKDILIAPVGNGARVIAQDTTA